MSDKSGTQAWSRLHKNGMVALVFAMPDNPGLFVAGAVPANGGGALGTVRGPLEAAKAYADNAAKCVQPCACSGWES